MSAQRCRAAHAGGGETVAAGRQHRHPVFMLTPQQVIQRCQQKKLCLICAGQVLALMALMEVLDWNISVLAEHSHVSRSMISEMLILEKCGTTHIVNCLAETLGLELYAFDLLAKFSLLAEVSP